ncbi:MAG: DNA-3-methyladenine glycosylase [DPANN group archaeon]|nr:DNA-3-methyladenine glycosylase [DPANN group archaeon]
MKYRILPQEFYSQDTATVAKALLGKILCRKIDDKILAGKIVETEAYYGFKDPASKAFCGKKNKINECMWGPAGRVFVYTIHNQWMFNITTGTEDSPSGVLIRAVEPWREIDEMFYNRKKRNRKINKVRDLCSGPGKLSQSFLFDRALQGIDFTKLGDVFTLDNAETFKIESSHRIGVSRDLRRKLRFYIRGNKFVSK